MDLIFWRHAEADDWTEGCDDMQRSLTVRGEKQAKRMAGWLDRQLPEGTRIICSPARRCEQTALALGRKYKLRDELAPDATPDGFATALEGFAARGGIGANVTLPLKEAAFALCADDRSTMKRDADR